MLFSGNETSVSGVRMDLAKSIKQEDATMPNDELLRHADHEFNNVQPPIKITRRSKRVRVLDKQDPSFLREAGLELGSTTNKFHELKKSDGTPAHRSRCVSCYDRNLLESERMPNPKTKWVTTFCEDCPGKPFLCILCFSRIHCNNIFMHSRERI